MKTTLITVMIMVSSYSQFFSQEIPEKTSKEVVTSLNDRITNIENSFKIESEKKTTDEKINIIATYNDQLDIISSGLEKGSDIENIVPLTIDLLALRDFSETIASINNATDSSVGSSFADLVIEAASENLLPKYESESQNIKAKNKFTEVLKAIFNGPLVQGFVNSNPITSTINTVIQQAGFFDKRSTNANISKEQIKSIEKDKPALISVDLANADGTSFGKNQIENFNKSIQGRINFYAKLNMYTSEQKIVTNQLYAESALIKRSLKVSKTEICKLLGISPDNAAVELRAKYEPDNVDIQTIKNYLRSANFKEAVKLSGYAKEQLPDVKDFNKRVVESVKKHIAEYIAVLNEYAGKPESKLEQIKVNQQIAKLTDISNTLSTVK